MIASGYAELDQNKYEEALHYFGGVRDFAITPKFFLHWYWRIQAQLGTSVVCLKAGNVVNARLEAEALLESALSTADPNLHALAWDMNARVAMAEKKWHIAEQCVQKALGVLETFEIPVTAWRVHASAWEAFRHTKGDAIAEHQRLRAEELIFAIANSFAPDEPLRQTFLSAPSVVRVLAVDHCAVAF